MMIDNTNTAQLYRNFQGELKRFIQKRVKDSDDVQDLLQDIFIKVHTHREQLIEPEKLRNWVYTISRNTIIDYYRKRKSTQSLNPEGLYTVMEEYQVGTSQDFEKCFVPFINALPNEDRELLEKVDIQGVKQKELARHMNLSYSGLKSRVQRARGKMKHLFLQCCDIKFDSTGQPVGCHPRNSCD